MADQEGASKNALGDHRPSKSLTLVEGHGGQSQQSQSQGLSRLKVRKHSYGFTGVPGIRPVERTSQVAMEFKRPPLVYLPTYQLDTRYKFNVDDVTELINEALDEAWTGHKYNASESPTLAMRLAGDLMRKVKGIGYNRYRVLSIVTIGQKRSQSYNNTISFIWDYERDGYAEVHRETTTAFIQVIVFGIYFD